MNKVKIIPKQEEADIEATPVPEQPETPNPESATDYGVGGVYRSIGGGKRVKIEA